MVDSTGKVVFQQPPAGTVQAPVDTLLPGRTLLQNYQLNSQNNNFNMIAQSASAVPPARRCGLFQGWQTLHASLCLPGQRTLCATVCARNLGASDISRPWRVHPVAAEPHPHACMRMCMDDPVRRVHARAVGVRVQEPCGSDAGPWSSDRRLTVPINPNP